MGIFTRLFGITEPVQEAPQNFLENKENKDLLWNAVSEIMSYIDEIRPELARAQQKKWARATISDFRNFHSKIGQMRITITRYATKIEAVPLQSPMFQDYSRNLLTLFRTAASSLSAAEQQLSGEKNIVEIPNLLNTAGNNLDEAKSYWITKVRKNFLE